MPSGDRMTPVVVVVGAGIGGGRGTNGRLTEELEVDMLPLEATRAGNCALVPAWSAGSTGDEAPDAAGDVKLLVAGDSGGGKMAPSGDEEEVALFFTSLLQVVQMIIE